MQEPKLDNARRIVAEWPALDQEARDFTAQVRTCTCSLRVRTRPSSLVRFLPPDANLCHGVAMSPCKVCHCWGAVPGGGTTAGGVCVITLATC